MPSIKLGIALFDAIIAVLCFVWAFAWREGDAMFIGNTWNFSEEFAPYGTLILFVVLIRLITIKTQDLYRLRGEFSFFDDGIKVFKATAIGSLFIIALAFMYRGGFKFTAFPYSRLVFVADFFFALIFYLIFRFTIRYGQILARKRGINLIPTLIVGTGREAELCIAEMQENKELGYRVIGIIETDSGLKTQDSKLPIVGKLEDLPELVVQTGASEVIITEQNVSSEVLFDVMMRCGRRKGVEFKLSPNLFDNLPRKTEVDQIGSLPMIQLFREPLSPFWRFVKRLEDIALSSIALTFFSPIILLITILIKLDSKGTIFYKQKRVGMDGRQFSFYKFRTMTMNNDDSEHREYLKNYISGEAESTNSEGETVFKLNDARVTKVGKWLRRLSLDEIPQLFNVLRGEMSVVGPRPPIPYEVEVYNATQRRRLDMKPGITGLWQVSGRNRLTFEQMLGLDVYYIENWSLWLDLKIIFLTPWAMIRGDGAK
jgi:exopolysaccharide biosynthesis polyprenyl glycosylphosphotransferase